MHTGWKIALGIAVVGGLGYVYWRYTSPPLFTINALNPLDGSGFFNWGPANGPIGPGTFEAGWGWSGSFSGFVPGTGWTVMIFKNGALYRLLTVNSVGTLNI